MQVYFGISLPQPTVWRRAMYFPDPNRQNKDLAVSEKQRENTGFGRYPHHAYWG